MSEIGPFPIFHHLSQFISKPPISRRGLLSFSSPPLSFLSIAPIYIYIYFFFSTGRFTSDRWWRSSVALVASTFPAVFTRTKLWEPLSLAAPSAAYVDHLETTPHKKPTPFRKHSSAGRACARQGGPLRACGRVSIKYREIRLWILISPVTNEESRGRDRIRFSRFSISFDYVLFFGHREDRLLRILLSFLFLPR